MFVLLMCGLLMIAAIYDEARRRYAARVRAAFEAGGLSHKVAALTLGIDEGQLSRQINLGILSGAAIEILDPLTGGRLAAAIVDDLGVLTFHRWATQQLTCALDQAATSARQKERA